MLDPAIGTIQCSGCGKRYRWRPELAGRRVKCACGAVISVAQSPQGEEEVYGIAEPAPAASAPAETAARAPHVKSPQAGQVPAYQSKGACATPEDYFPDRAKDLYMPLVLLGISVPVLFIASWWQGSDRGVGPAQAMAEVGSQLVVGTVIMLAAILFAAKRRGFTVGRFWTAVLKLSAVSLGPSAVMTVLSIFLRFVPLGEIINLIVGFCLYFALIGAFFDLDESDTWYCVAIVFIVNVSILLSARWLLRG